MKSRQASPQPEVVQLRTWRLNSSSEPPAHMSAEPPSLQLTGLNGLFQTNPNSNGFSTFTLDPIPSSPHQNGVVSDGAADSPRAASPANETPYRPSLLNSRRFHSQPFPDAHATDPASPTPSTFGTPNSDHQDQPWSSAVGRATTGKSGRVIERLMAENDRLRREKNLTDVKLEEEVRRGDSAKSAMEGLRSTNDNLTTIHETDKSILARRERKLEEMKLELEAERQRREKAEIETRETCRERDEAVERLRKELRVATEQSTRATTQYDVISMSFRGLRDDQSRTTRELRAQMASLQDAMVADQQTRASMQTAMEHYRSEFERAQDANRRLQTAFETYKGEAEQELKDIRQAAQSNSEANDRKQEEMQAVKDEMRYVINVRTNVKGLE
ncbi:MAG: hypothetical protein Q9180_002618 [Flavoplaca navasiana]